MLSYPPINHLIDRQGIRLIKSCRRGPKVLESPTGEIIKIFHPKKWLSSNTYSPYAHRFCHNAKCLSAINIEVPKIKSHYFCEDSHTHIITYDKLPGEDVYSLLCKDNNTDILNEVIDYVSILHQKGVFFRGIHLGNLLYQGKNRFALLDFTDLKKINKPLSILMRYRNLKHLFSYKEDQPMWKKFGIKNSLDRYLQHAGLPLFSQTVLNVCLSKLCSGS